MEKQKAKRLAHVRRARRAKQHLLGDATRPRLCVTRSNAHIYAQVIDDTKAVTLCSASTLDEEFKKSKKGASNKEGATYVGELIAKRAQEKGIKEVTFDRSGRLYHGRLQALAEGARSAGLKF